MIMLENFIHYAGIMLDALTIALRPKLCRIIYLTLPWSERTEGLGRGETQGTRLPSPLPPDKMHFMSRGIVPEPVKDISANEETCAYFLLKINRLDNMHEQNCVLIIEKNYSQTVTILLSCPPNENIFNLVQRVREAIVFCFLTISLLLIMNFPGRILKSKLNSRS